MAQVGSTIYLVDEGRVKLTLRWMSHEKKKGKKKKNTVLCSGIDFLSSTALLESPSWDAPSHFLLPASGNFHQLVLAEQRRKKKFIM